MIKLKIGEIYINKENKSIIQIDSFATHMGRVNKPIIIYSYIENHPYCDWEYESKIVTRERAEEVIQKFIDTDGEVFLEE